MYAVRGILVAIREQRNLKVQTIIALITIDPEAFEELVGDAMRKAQTAALLVEPQQVVAELVALRRPQLADRSSRHCMFAHE